MNGFHYLMGGVYRTDCDFASAEGFGMLLEDRFSDLPFEQAAVVDRVRRLVEEFTRPVETVDGEKAALLLLARDLRRVGDVLAKERMPDPDVSLPRHRDRYEASLRALGLDFSPPKLFIVDTFPRPYHTMDWVATSPDRADWENHGVEPGNYFKRAHLTPYRSEILLAHEMTHQVIGEVDPHWLGRGLEEGIAVVFGELYVGASVVGRDTARIYAQHQWFDRRASQCNQLYVEYARMAALIYQMYGLNGLLALVQGGRRRIKEVELSCLEGDFNLDLPRGGWDDEYGSLVYRVTMTTVGNLVVSPLAKYVAAYATAGATTADIATAARVPHGDAAAALEELQHQTVLVMMDDGRVEYSDLDLVTSSHSLRYHV